MTRTAWAAVIILCAMTSASHAKDASPIFRAGAATSNITPFIGEAIVGGFVPAPSKGIHDELHARCLVLDDGKTRIAIVICDNVGITREICDEAKRLTTEQTKIPANRILLASTHTHSAVSARSKHYLVGDSEFSDYQKFLVRRIADGVQRAVTNLEPARIGWGVGREPAQVFNRRWYMKSASDMANPFGGVDRVRMNPPSGPNLIEPAGPTDPEISFFSIQSRDGRPIAVLGNYSLHYVGGTSGAAISADYFAVFADEMQRLLAADRQDPPFVGIMTNGTSGDVNNINFVERGARYVPYEKMRVVARACAAEVYRVHQTMVWNDWVPLTMIERELTLESRKASPEQIEQAKKVLSGELKIDHARATNYAERTLDMAQAPATVSVPIQVLRIGELAIATSPFETFTETGLEIKSRSPFKPTFTIELANGSYGYLPTPEQHRLGGYETWLGTNRVEVQASRKMTELMVDMLEELHTDKSADR